MGLPGLPARREVEPRFSRALSPGGSHISSSPALPDGGWGRGAEAHKAPWSRVRGCPAEAGRERGARARVGLSPEPRRATLPPRDSPGGSGRKASPAERRFPAPRLPPSPFNLPCRLEREGISYPNPGWVGGGQAAGAGRPQGPPVHPQSGGSTPRTRPGPPRPPRPRAAPVRRAPIPSSPLARLRAFSGLWK